MALEAVVGFLNADIFLIRWKVDLSAPSVATAIISTIDGITQTGKKLEKASRFGLPT